LFFGVGSAAGILVSGELSLLTTLGWHASDKKTANTAASTNGDLDRIFI